MGSMTCHFMPLAGVTTENWLPAIAAQDAVSMSCGYRAEPILKLMGSARFRNDLDAHGTSATLADAAAAEVARGAASALVAVSVVGVSTSQAAAVSASAAA